MKPFKIPTAPVLLAQQPGRFFPPAITTQVTDTATKRPTMPIHPSVCEKLNSHTRSICAQFGRNHPRMKLEDYQLLYWTPEERQCVKNALRISDTVTSPGAINREYVVPYLNTLGDTETASFTFAISFEASSGFRVWPRNAITRAGADPAHIDLFQRALEHAAQLHCERNTFIGIVRDLLDTLPSLAAVRYCFPPIIGMLRECYQNELAAKIETPKKTNFSPSVSRQMIRWANSWYTQQLLLESFTKGYPCPEEFAPTGDCISITARQ